MKPINEDTAVTLGVVALVVAATMWLASVHATTNANAETIIQQRDSIKEMNESISELKADVKVVRSILERKP